MDVRSGGAESQRSTALMMYDFGMADGRRNPDMLSLHKLARFHADSWGIELQGPKLWGVYGDRLLGSTTVRLSTLRTTTKRKHK